MEEGDLDEVPRNDVHVVGVHTEAVGAGEINLKVVVTTRGFVLRGLRERMSERRRGFTGRCHHHTSHG